MSTTTTPAEDVKTADETVETKTTTTAEPSTKETKEESSTVDNLDTSEADKEIAEDLAKVGKEDEADDTDETKKPAKKSKESEKEEETEEKSEEESNKDEPEDLSKEDVDEARGKSAEARKATLQNEIRELVSKRNEIRDEIKQEIAKAYRTETPEELEEQGLSPEEAEKEVLRQENEMLKFNTHVADLNNTLNIEALQVMQDFPVFDPDSPEYDKDLSKRVRTLYERAAQTEIDDKTNLVISSNLPPYEFYKAFAETHKTSGEKSRVQGQIDGQKAADKELAAAETPSSTAPKTQKTDPFLKGLLSADD